ncbi:putative exported protein [Blastochloris viridis]|nr:putative exported protein [Blastochloris viridis]
MAMGFPRSVLVGCVAAVLFGAAASAETTTFVIPNVDGYGIDECLASGRPCGQAAAAAWCRSRDYTAVVEFGRFDRDESTGSLPATQVAQLSPITPSCSGRSCREQVAIICVR